MSTIALDYAPAAPTTVRSMQRHLYVVPTPRTQRPVIRLTRRGRIVMVLVALTAIIGLGITLGDSTAATSRSGAPAAHHMVTVKSGQTLWSIAVAANPGGDIRQTVDDIMRLNSLPSAAGLQMGHQIAVPSYAK